MKAIKRTVLIIAIVSGMIAILFPASWNILSNPGSFDKKISPTILYCVLEESREGTYLSRDRSIQENIQEAAYKNLAPGKYFLRIQRTGNDKNLKKGMLVRIILIPKFWTTWWFKILVFLLVLVILLYLYKIRMKFLLPKGNFQAKIGYVFSKHNLSKREQEIALLLFQGDTKKSIEGKLFISPHTVKNHTYNIYRKLRIKNRVQLFNLFQDLR